MKINILFFLLFISYSSQAQTGLITKEEHRFFFDGKSYKMEELGPILKEDEVIYKNYKVGLVYNKISKIMATTGFVLGIGGAIRARFESEFFPDKWGKRIALAGIFTSFFAVIPRLLGTENIKNAINTFNFKVLSAEGFKSDLSVSFDSTENGIGFLLNF